MLHATGSRTVHHRGGGGVLSQRALHVCRAKKGGKGEKKGAQKKGGSALAELLKKKEQAAQSATVGEAAGDELALHSQYASPEVLLDLLDVCSSYWRHYKEYLLETDLEKLAEALYKAPFVCLAHNIFVEGVTEPTFVYANRAALRLWEASWDELVGLPSRQSAEEGEQESRNSLIEAARKMGCVNNYEGWRRSLKGKRFLIKGARFFNVGDSSGELWGQAVVFNTVELEDGTIVHIEGETLVAEEPPAVLTEEDLEAAEAAVVEQAGAVRALKATGLTNQDADVQTAVVELQRRKQRVEEVKQKLQEQAAEADYDESKLFDSDPED